MGMLKGIIVTVVGGIILKVVWENYSKIFSFANDFYIRCSDQFLQYSFMSAGLCLALAVWAISTRLGNIRTAETDVIKLGSLDETNKHVPITPVLEKESTLELALNDDQWRVLELLVDANEEGLTLKQIEVLGFRRSYALHCLDHLIEQKFVIKNEAPASFLTPEMVSAPSFPDSYTSTPEGRNYYFTNMNER